MSTRPDPPAVARLRETLNILATHTFTFTTGYGTASGGHRITVSLDDVHEIVRRYDAAMQALAEIETLAISGGSYQLAGKIAGCARAALEEAE